MGKLFILAGMSAAGKDTVRQKLLEECPHIKDVVSYTTRPKRENETEGIDYNFISDALFDKMEREGKVIEKRVYESWKYGTIDDGTVDFSKGSFLAIKDPAGIQALKDYYGKENVISIFIHVDDGIRLTRAITRELSQEKPKYAEICKRFLADEADFKGFEPDFTVDNINVLNAVKEVKKIIRNNRK